MSNSFAAYPLSNIDGLGPHAQARLKAEGIRTTAALLESASTPKGRKALAAKTGLSEQQLLAWANIADCASRAWARPRPNCCAPLAL